MELFLVLVVVATAAIYYFFHEPPITEGIIVEKNHEPERQGMIYGCSLSAGPMRVLSIEPERWIIVIEATIKNKQKRRKIHTSEKRYNELSVGETCSVK
jgi:hypothetical protein